MENEKYFGNYELSETILERLREMKSLLDTNAPEANLAWEIINPKKERKSDPEKIVPALCEIHKDTEEENLQAIGGSSTQFFSTQQEREDSTASVDATLRSKWLDVAESLLESLHTTANEILALSHLDNLSEREANCVVEYLSKKLNSQGTYNFCHSICAMNAEQSMRYVRMICSNLLLRQIIELEDPSRQINTVITELVEKFPEDVLEFIYIPMLNLEIRDTSVFCAIINSYPSQRKNDLILNFLIIVQELKDWHISVLSQLINTKIADNSTRDKMLQLLLEKATIYSRDKNYGKFILSSIKLNAPFTEMQKSQLYEIVEVNETAFKRVMKNVLKNMYLHGDLWYIS